MRKQINARLQNLKAYCDTAVRAYALPAYWSDERKKAEMSTKISGMLIYHIEEQMSKMFVEIKPIHAIWGAISKMRWVK